MTLRAGKPCGQPAEGLNLAIADRIVVRAGDDVEVQDIVRHPVSSQRTMKGLSAEIKEELILGAGVDPQAAHGLELARVVGNHADRIPVEPPVPGIWPDLAGPGIDGEHGISVGARREAC